MEAGESLFLSLSSHGTLAPSSSILRIWIIVSAANVSRSIGSDQAGISSLFWLWLWMAPPHPPPLLLRHHHLLLASFHG